MKLQKQLYCLSLILLSCFSVTSSVISADNRNNNETTFNDVKKETAEAVESVKLYSFEQRDEMLKKSKLYLNKLDSHIDLLEQQIDNEWDSMNAISREKARKLLKNLQKERVNLAELAGELKNSSIETWDGIKERFLEAYSSLSSDTADAIKQLKPLKKSRTSLIFLHLSIAIIIALILFIIFMLLKRTGPWKSKWVFFILLFLITWVGGIWMMPFGPVIGDVAIVPFIYFGILFCLILASIQPAKNKIVQDKKSNKMTEVDVYDNAMIFAVLDLFFWILFIFLLIALLVHYFK